MMSTVAVLFARSDSVYKSIPGCDVYDIDRDARTFPGGMPVVCHPPCRAWGAMRTLANPPAGEKELALLAVAHVRREGGILEHPATSMLWPAAGLPEGRARDEFGGWTLTIDQYAFGHVAHKPTRLYIVGCPPSDIPDLPLRLGTAYKKITTRRGMIGQRCTQQKCEHTPPALAHWLVDLARRCAPTRTQD